MSAVHPMPIDADGFDDVLAVRVDLPPRALPLQTLWEVAVEARCEVGAVSRFLAGGQDMSPSLLRRIRSAFNRLQAIPPAAEEKKLRDLRADSSTKPRKRVAKPRRAQSRTLPRLRTSAVRPCVVDR